jgi:hypothetical protein
MGYCPVSTPPFSAPTESIQPIAGGSVALIIRIKTRSLESLSAFEFENENILNWDDRRRSKEHRVWSALDTVGALAIPINLREYLTFDKSLTAQKGVK